MPFRPFADEIIRLNERHGSTPVLVTATNISLRTEFFTHLVDTMATRSDRSIRIDWYRRMSGLFDVVGDRFASMRAAQINRRLGRLMAGRAADARITITPTIGRPGGTERELVIGLCDEQLELPPWTTAIRLGGSPAGNPAVG